MEDANASAPTKRVSTIFSKINGAEEQKELFLWKYRDITREAVNEEFKMFLKFDISKTGELDEHEAMMLLENRGCATTAVALRALLADIDKDQSHSLSFLEYCCFWFKRSYDDLNDFVDEEARARAMAEAMEAGEKARQAEEAIEAAALLEEQKALQRAAELEAESKLTGVAGAAAFFRRKAEEASTDTTMTNAEKITAEAARRRELRDAKKAQSAALEAALKQQSAADVAKEIVKAKLTAAAEAAAEEANKLAKEKADRKARKDALNASFLAKVNAPKS